MSNTIKDMPWKVKLAQKVNPTVMVLSDLTDLDTPLVKGSEAVEILHSSHKGHLNGLVDTVLRGEDLNKLFPTNSAYQEDNTLEKRADRRNMNQMCHQMTNMANSDPSALLDMDWD